MGHYRELTGLRPALDELKRELDGIDQALERLVVTLSDETAIVKRGRTRMTMRRIAAGAVDTGARSFSRRITKPVRPDRASRDARARRVEVESAAAVLAQRLNRPAGDVRLMLDEELKGGTSLAEAKRRVRASVEEGNA